MVRQVVGMQRHTFEQRNEKKKNKKKYYRLKYDVGVEIDLICIICTYRTVIAGADARIEIHRAAEEIYRHALTV